MLVWRKFLKIGCNLSHIWQSIILTDDPKLLIKVILKPDAGTLKQTCQNAFKSEKMKISAQI